MKRPDACTHAVYDTDPERACGKPAIARAWDPELERTFPVCEDHGSNLLPQVEQFDLAALTPTHTARTTTKETDQ